MPPSVPQEVVDLIIDQYVDIIKARDFGQVSRSVFSGHCNSITPGPIRFKDLKNCALASRIFLSQCRKYLFSGLTIESTVDEPTVLNSSVFNFSPRLSTRTIKQLNGLARVMKTNSSLAQYINVVHVTWDAGEWFGDCQPLQIILPLMKEHGGPPQIKFKSRYGHFPVEYPMTPHPAVLSLIGPRTRIVHCSTGEKVPLSLFVKNPQVERWMLEKCGVDQEPYMDVATNSGNFAAMRNLRVEDSSEVLAAFLRHSDRKPLIDFSALHTFEVRTKHEDNLVAIQKVILTAGSALKVFSMTPPDLNSGKRRKRVQHCCDFDLSGCTGLKEVRLCVLTELTEPVPVGKRLSDLLSTLDTIPIPNAIERLQIDIGLRLTIEHRCSTFLEEDWAGLNRKVCEILSSSSPSRPQCAISVIIIMRNTPYDVDDHYDDCESFTEDIPELFDGIRSYSSSHHIKFALDVKKPDIQ